MAEFVKQDLSDSTFDDVYLDRADLHDISMRDAHFRLIDLRGSVFKDAYLSGVEIWAEFDSLRINGVDVAPLLEAELNRLHPDRVKMRPTTADGFREAWTTLERLWEGTVARARELPEEKLDERVDGEWSFLQTLRHLSFATDAWVRRAYLGDPAPWHPLDLPHDDMPDSPPVPRDYDARPSLQEVLDLRQDRMATMRAVVEELTDERLTGMTTAVLEPGYPEQVSFPVRRCLGAIINEEWQHRLYVERDLDALSGRGGRPAATP